MGNPVVHFEIHGTDRGGLGAFYAELFGWKLNAVDELNYTIVDTQGDGGIAGGLMASDQIGTVVYVQVDDPQAVLDRAEALGGKTIQGVTEIPGAATLAMFTDPQGVRVGLVKG